MGKIKSRILTGFVAAVILVVAFFAFFSWNVPGSNGVKRYNSFISSIRLGGDFTGNAYTVIYPDGVISAADYEFGIPDDEDKRAEYESKYQKCGEVYVSSDTLATSDKDELKAKIAKDAEVLNKRFSKKDYSGYSVSVQNDYTIRISVPTDFSYSAYAEKNATARSEATTAISQTIQALSYSGELSLRNTKVGKIYDSKLDNYILTPIKADITSYFKSFKKYVSAGNYAVKVNLTKEGRELFNSISSSVSANEDDKNVRFYIGEDQLLALTCESTITDKSFYISTNNKATAQDYAIVLNSAANGETLSVGYNLEDMEIIYPTASLGDYSAILLFVALMLVLVGAIVYAIVRYKKLGLVFAMSALVFALALIIALVTLGTQVTAAVALSAVLGFALMCGVNFVSFEAVRKNTEKGHTMQSAIKAGYKSLLATMIDMHLVLLGVSIIVGLVAVGEVAACGLVLFISTIASYILHWFTRFMWFVASSPAKDKFKFGGYKRRMIDD